MLRERSAQPCRFRTATEGVQLDGQNRERGRDQRLPNLPQMETRPHRTHTRPRHPDSCQQRQWEVHTRKFAQPHHQRNRMERRGHRHHRGSRQHPPSHIPGRFLLAERRRLQPRLRRERSPHQGRDHQRPSLAGTRRCPASTRSGKGSGRTGNSRRSSDQEQGRCRPGRTCSERSRQSRLGRDQHITQLPLRAWIQCHQRQTRNRNRTR